MPYKSIELSNNVNVSQQARQKSQFYRGFSTLDNTNPGSKLYDLALIRQDIINQFNTKKGTRVMNPTFGSDIWDLLMDPADDTTRDAISADITAVVTADPRATPTKIDLTEYEQGYTLELTLVLNGTDQSSNMVLTFDQNLGLITQ
jgi:phage baseplate assembly protein W